MTIQEALDHADELRPNMMSRPLKIKHLSILDGLIHHEIRMKHEHDEDAVCPEYNEDTDPSTVLLVPPPYDEELYTSWLISKIDLQNMEMDKYNNDRILFENAYDTMSDWWTRTHMPACPVRHVRL